MLEQGCISGGIDFSVAPQPPDIVIFSLLGTNFCPSQKESYFTTFFEQLHNNILSVSFLPLLNMRDLHIIMEVQYHVSKNYYLVEEIPL